MKNIASKRILLIISIIFCLHPFVHSQENKTVDSLLTIIKTYPADKNLDKMKALISLGFQYMTSSKYPEAEDCYQKALSLAQKTNNDSLQVASYAGLAAISFYHQDFTKDSLYHLKALEICKLTKNKFAEGKILRNMAGGYAQRGKLKEATKYYEQALAIFNELNLPKFSAGVYSNMAAMYRWDFRKSIELSLAAKKIWDKYPNDGVLPAANIGNLGVYYFYLVKFDSLKFINHDSIIPASPLENLKKAELYLNQSIQMAKENNDINHQSHYTGELAELQAYKGDFKNAYYNISNYYTTQDSIFSQANKNKIASLESQRAIDLKNKEIENKELQIGNQRKNMWLLLSLIGFLFAVGIIFYRQSIIRKRTNAKLMQLNMELDEANKVKAKFFGIISHDLRKPIANLANFLQLQKLKPGLFSEQQVVEREQKIKTATDALLETMEATLLWSKGQMENFRPEITEFRVGKLYSYLQKFFSGTEQVSFHFTGDENILLKSDEHYLRTIMQNLTANAIKALQQNPAAAIEWKAWQDGEKIFLSIADNGTGASIEQLKALYDESAGMGGGNGLGLHIIRDLAKAIHCSVEMDASYQNGTKFLLSFASNKNNMA